MKKKIVYSIFAILLAVVFSGLISSALAADVRIERDLQKGMKGEDVAFLQRFLKEQGFYTYYKITGYFGSITEKAVKDFQRAYGLVADGIVGPVTRGVINQILESDAVVSRSDSSNVYTVQAGDSIWKISRRYNIPMDRLLLANGLTPSSVLYPGQKIIIPKDTQAGDEQIVHVVQPGDTMWKISRYYNVSLDALLLVNGINENSVLYVGQKVTVPVSGKPYVTYVHHTVKKGDTLWSLAYEYGVPAKEIAQANGVTDSTVLYVGQVLKIPRHVIPVKPTPGSKYGELLDWWTEAQYVFHLGAVATVVDFKTGISFKAKRTYGYGHADCEPLTEEDTRIMKGIWEKYEQSANGTVDYWVRRPVLVIVNGRKLAASASAMLHAGVDWAPDGAYVKWRSDNYGPGINFDKIKGNGANGHFDIHFLNSTRHRDGLVDEKHQAAIRIAAGQKLS